MGKKKILVGILFLAIMITSNLLIVFHSENLSDVTVGFHIVADAETDMGFQVYFKQIGYINEDYSDKHTIAMPLDNTLGMNDYEVAIPADVTSIKIVPGNAALDRYECDKIYLAYGDEIVQEYTLDDSHYNAEQMYYSWDVDYDKLVNTVTDARSTRNLIIKILACAVIDALFILVWIKLRAVTAIPLDVIRNRKLIGSLAKNDFKQKFAGSYLGTVWAFVQPIITVLVYWFVFEKALNVGTQSTKAGIDIPFVLWLIAGLVPWFFFSEVIASGTNALIEYNYLVKKVVFKISTLPVVKAISSLFVHLFFVIFTIILYSCYQYFPTLYTLQLIYYSFCMFLLAVGIIYAFSAIMVFFRDLSQIVNVLLQIGMWMTPIMWNMDAMANRIPGWAIVILKLNPMYYIVNGYRDALYNHVWFWERGGMTAYFWIFTLIVLVGGTAIFRKLQQHFADVL